MSPERVKWVNFSGQIWHIINAMGLLWKGLSVWVQSRLVQPTLDPCPKDTWHIMQKDSKSLEKSIAFNTLLQWFGQQEVTRHDLKQLLHKPQKFACGKPKLTRIYSEDQVKQKPKVVDRGKHSYPALYARALANALAEPPGNTPIGVFIAVCQSALSISPFTTCTQCVL